MFLFKSGNKFGASPGPDLDPVLLQLGQTGAELPHGPISSKSRWLCSRLVKSDTCNQWELSRTNLFRFMHTLPLETYREAANACEDT